MWHVYIIQCADATFYTGITTDIPRRIKEHNAKKGGNYTQTRTPVKLIYQEPQPNHSAALKREAQIKRWTKSKKIALISGNLTELSRLSVSRD
ncbi:MAG: GIY-YIG nuclease family protein [Candidatus Omnitrophota bacterium]